MHNNTTKFIIFLPGIGCDAWLFKHQIEVLQKDCNVLALPVTRYQNLDDYLNTILDSIPENAIIVGHAFGGWLGQWLAIKYPDRIQKLILFCTGTGRLNTGFTDIIKVIMDFYANMKDNPFAEFFKTTIVTNNPFAQALSMMTAVKEKFPLWNDFVQTVQNDLQNMDTSDKLQNIVCPTLLLQGKNDLIFAQDMALLGKSIPQSCTINIDACGPLLTLEKPHLVTSFMQSWLLHS